MSSKNIFWGILICALALVPCAGAQLSAKKSNSNAALAGEQDKKGAGFLEKRDWDGALREYREAVRLLPDDAEAHNGVGRALGEKGDLNGAIGEFQEALRLQPDNAEAHNGLGWVLSAKGDIDGAVREFREATRLKPDYVKAHYNLGWALTRKNDLDGAVREYREAIRLKPDEPDEHINLGLALTEKNDLDGGMREYREAIRLKPDDPDAHYDLGLALTKKNDLDGGVREYREAIRLKPDDPEEHQALGAAFLERKDIDGALREYRVQVRLVPDSADAHANVGVALSRKGDWDGALAEDREAIRLQPDNALAHFYLGRGLEHKGNRRTALEEYQKATKLDPKNSAFAATYGRLDSEMSILPGNWSPAMVRAFTFSAALVPSFLLLGYFRARDLYPEPARALWATFALGALIIFPVLLLDWPLAEIVKQFHGAISHGLAEALFNAAIPEELLKFAVVVLFCARLKAFNEPMDGVVYGAVASLGFATLENVGYVAENGVSVAISRALTAVPSHAFMGAVMGYFVGQWRFGVAARRKSALLKAYFVPVTLHWMYDFPLLAYGEANKLSGPAKQIALVEIAPFMFLTIAILLLESFWAVLLVNRTRKEQIQIARDAVSAVAAADGAMDIVALMNAPDSPPTAWPGWVMAAVGGLLATFGGFISLCIVLYFAESRARGDAGFDVVGAAVAGGIPLLVGLVLFVYGVRRIHASHRGVPQPAIAAAGA